MAAVWQGLGDGDDGPRAWKWADPRWVPLATCVAFDLDDTLVTTRHGAKFPTNAADWQWWHPSVPTTLQALAARGDVCLAVLSNQLGVSKGHVVLEDVQARLAAVAAASGVPLVCVFATQDDWYRKPRPGMWAAAGLDACFTASCTYVGDAAGRPAVPRGRAKDFSAGDLKFALNLGVAFATPEQFFLGSTHPVDVDRALADVAPVPPGRGGPPATGAGAGAASGPLAPEVVVLVGPPAAGKSTYAARALPHHVCVNQDTLKTKARCVKAARDALASGRPVVVDATNRDAATRADWVQLARDAGVPARAVMLQVPKTLCFHQNVYRAVCGSMPGAPPGSGRHVPDIVIHTFFKNVQAPTVGEGFTTVEAAVPLDMHFPTAQHEALYYSHLQA